MRAKTLSKWLILGILGMVGSILVVSSFPKVQASAGSCREVLSHYGSNLPKLDYNSDNRVNILDCVWAIASSTGNGKGIGIQSGPPFYGGAEGSWASTDRTRPLVEYRTQELGGVAPRAIAFNVSKSLLYHPPLVANNEGHWQRTSHSADFTPSDAYFDSESGIMWIVGWDSDGLAVYTYNDADGTWNRRHSWSASGFSARIHKGIIAWIENSSGDTYQIKYSRWRTGVGYCSPRIITNFQDNFNSSQSVAYLDIIGGWTGSESLKEIVYLRTPPSGNGGIKKDLSTSYSGNNCDSLSWNVSDLPPGNYPSAGWRYNQASLYIPDDNPYGYAIPEYVYIDSSNQLAGWPTSGGSTVADVYDLVVTSDSQFVVVRNQSGSLYFAAQHQGFQLVTDAGQPISVPSDESLFISATSLESGYLQIAWSDNSVIIPDTGQPSPTPPPDELIVINEALNNKTCDEVCYADYGKICSSIGYNTTADNGSLWTHLLNCSTLGGHCGRILADKNYICHGYQAEWTRCRCLGTAGSPTPTPTSAPTPTPTPTPTSSPPLPTSCDPAQPSTMALAVANGISYHKFYWDDYQRDISFYLIGKKYNNAHLNSADDYRYYNYRPQGQSSAGDPSVERPYLILGVNDYYGVGGSYPPAIFQIKVGQEDIAINIPGIAFSGNPRERFYFYVALDGSLYYANSSRGPVIANSWTQSIDLAPSQAFKSSNRATICPSNDQLPPQPPSGEFTCFKRASSDPGNPAYLSLKLAQNGNPLANYAAYLLVNTQRTDLPPAWCRFTTDAQGVALLNSLYNLYWSDKYSLYAFSQNNNQGTIHSFQWSDNGQPRRYLESSKTVPQLINLTDFSQQYSWETTPPSGTATVTGSPQVVLAGVPTSKAQLPVYLINADYPSIVFGDQTDSSGNFQLTGVPSGRYFLILHWWEGPDLYIYEDSLVVRSGSNSLGTLLLH